MNSYDYIIVGAGSAGCVLANRLSEDPNKTVLLIETGGSDRSIFIQMPTALSIPMNMEKYNWGFKTTPEPFLDNRKLDCPRGKVLGGSSSINGMVYVRGHPCDFDEWQNLGADGWGYSNCLPYFRKAETWIHGSDPYRGDNGPLTVSEGNAMKNPLYRAFINAGQEAGYPLTKDYNGFQQEGFGPMHMTVRRGERCSTSLAYIQPAKSRQNLTIRTGAYVTKIIITNNKATGLHYIIDGETKTLEATEEIILSAGSIGSPTLLQRSGIGPGKILQDAGVPIIHDLPGVGANLQDHLEVYFQYRCIQPITLNSKLNWFNKGLIGGRWIINRSGLGATNHFESCGFIRSAAGIKWPDIQFHFLPAAMRYDGRAAFNSHGFQVHVGPNKPTSRGIVKILNSHRETPPNITFNYLATQKDREKWRTCLKLTREILSQPALDPYRGDEIQPAINLDDNEKVDTWVKQNVESAYHPSCTCKMGDSDDPTAVLDSNCLVMGLERLRVVDSSIFPTITNGNLNAPTIMAAEKIADLIRGKPKLHAQADYWIDDQWSNRQRVGSPLRSNITED